MLRRQCSLHCFLSTSDDVNHGENYNPNCIDKVPVQREYNDAAKMILVHLSRQTEDENDSKHNQAGCDVKRVQPNQRVICGSEQIGRNRQPMLVNQPVPLLPVPKQKKTTEEN